MSEVEGRFGAGTVFLAALGGATVGAAVALLVAPRSGRETRHQLASGVHSISRMPEALKKASHAAWDAMGDELEAPSHPARHGAKA